MYHADPDPSVSFAIERFLHELAVRPKYLHAVGLAVAYINETVVRALDAVHRVAELLRRRRVRIVVAEIGIIGLVAVRAPVAFILPVSASTTATRLLV